MSQSQVVSYKELQTEAKKLGIPANMKRQFLESAIEAHAENNLEKMNSIVQYHKNNRKRRAYKPPDPVKSKVKKTKNDTAVVVTHQANCPVERFHVDLTDDDDDNPDNFHPDSTSTPNHHHHSYVNRLANPEHSPSTSPFSSLNNVRPSYESRSTSNISSFFTSVPALLPRNLAQESYGGIKNVAGPPYYDSSVYKSSFLQQSQSQLCLYDNSNYNFARENYYPSQSPFNSRYYESNAPSTVTELGFERLMLNTMENEGGSSYLPNVPQLSDVRECSSTPSSSWSANTTVIDNSRTLVPVPANDMNQANPFDCFNNRVTDAGSIISAEFDSNSDTESLGLSEEMACLFDSEVENEKRRPAPSPNISDFYPRPNVCSEILQFNGDRSSFANSVQDQRSIVEKNNQMDTERSQDSGNGSLPPYQPLQESNDHLHENDLLPSVSTLLPDYNLQASYQAYVKWTKACYDLNHAADNPSNQFVQPYDKMPNFNFSDDLLQNMEDGSLYAKTLENSNYWRNFSTLFGSNTSQSNNSILRTFLGNKSTFSFNDELLSGNSFVTSSMLENMTALPMNLIDQVAEEMCEMNGHDENEQNFQPRANSTTNQETTQLVYKHESISIQDTVRDNNVTKDVYRESLEIKMNKPVENMALASLRESTTQIRIEDQPVSSFRPCKNKAYGCVDIFKNNETRAQHEKECLYQVVHCPLDKCDWCDIMNTLTAHIYECHREDLNIGKDFVYVINRSGEEDVPFVTYFQLYEGTIFVITLDINEKRCITTMQYLPEVETTDYRNKRIRGLMQLIHFTNKVESKSWKGVVRPYFENDETLFQKGNTLQSSIANSKNIVLRVLIN